MKKTLVILTSNEIKGITALFKDIPFDKFDESFAVDWNSKDGTVEFLKERGIRVISQTKKGRGDAFRIAADESQGDILVFFSSDGNEDPADTIKLAESVESGNDMVIASRFMPGSRNDQEGLLFPYRAWGNKFFTFLVNLFFQGHLSDTLNGLRAVRKEKFKELKLDAEGFAIEYQMSIRALKLKQKIKEIPTQEKDRIGGKSNVGSFSVGSRLLKLLFKEIFI